MSKKNKLLNRFLSKPKDFTFDELVTLLGYFGYYPEQKGKTSGSRVKFVSVYGFEHIKIHKPHGNKKLLHYQIEGILEELIKGGFIDEKESDEV